MFNIFKKKVEAPVIDPQEELQAKMEKEIEVKNNIKRTLTKMKSQSDKMETFKKECIESARRAAASNNTRAYEIAKDNLKNCVSRQRYIEDMISSYEASLQMTEMNKIVGEFLNGMASIAEQLKSITGNVDFVKAQLTYEKAMANNESQYEALDTFLKETQSSIKSFSDTQNNVTDEEINQLINGYPNCSSGASSSNDEFDKEIEDKMNKIRQQING